MQHNKQPSHFDKFINWCEHHIVTYPWIVLMMILLLAVITLDYTYNNLTINTNTGDMLSPNLPFQKNQRRIDEAFPQDTSNIILVVDANTPEESTIAANEAVNLLKIQKEGFESVYIATENDFFNQQALLFLDEKDLDDLAKKLTDAQPFIGHLALNFNIGGLFGIVSQALNSHEETLPMDINPMLQAINTTISNHLKNLPAQLSWQNLLAANKLDKDSKRTLIIAKPKMDFSQMLPSEAAETGAKNVRQAVMANNSTVKVRITGEPALEHDELESVAQGATLSGIISFVLVCIVQLIGVRSVKLLIITYIVLTTGLILTAGFAAVSVGHLNVISIAFASLYIGLGVDYAVHICLYYRERKARGYTNIEAIRQSMKGVGSSLFLCALTTAIGFFAFIPTDYSGVSELGIISGGGIFIGLIISLTALPALFCVLPVNNPKPIHSSLAPPFVVTFPFHYAKSIKIASVLLGIAACLILTRLTFDNNPINLRDPLSESVVTINELLKSKTDSPFALTSLADKLEDARSIATNMEKLPSVHDAITLSSFVAKNQQEKLAIIDDLNLMLANQLNNFTGVLTENGNQQAAMLKFSDELGKAIRDKSVYADLSTLQQLQTNVNAFIKQADSSSNPRAMYEALEKNLLGLLPFTMERLKVALTAKAYTIEDIPPYISTHWRSKNGIYKILINPEKDQNISDNQREFVAQTQSVDNAVTGLPVTNIAGGEAVVKAFIEAFGGAFAAILLVLLLIYRNIRNTLLVIMPLMLAALLTGATNVLLNNPFNFANIIALPLLLGMGIDSSILIMHRLHFNLQENESLLQSSTTRGIIFASITTLCSFSSLAFTAHRGMASMGLLLTIGLFYTVVCSLLVLPAWSGKRI
jgi:hopanoid biosynthesis associated RND transporter like protein HpnN